MEGAGQFAGAAPDVAQAGGALQVERYVERHVVHLRPGGHGRIEDRPPDGVLLHPVEVGSAIDLGEGVSGASEREHCTA
jgi:hypothetical protein